MFLTCRPPIHFNDPHHPRKMSNCQRNMRFLLIQPQNPLRNALKYWERWCGGALVNLALLPNYKPPMISNLAFYQRMATRFKRREKCR
ncbi:uncharacterized protein EKO05_0011295 [Ascochyta rabiei]|uniref:uncharacterized protein n=1 Tax=Didymella rabiei TaxID=5454 RepID=UPI002202B8A2|nr:uncharacterized protein EKO05_0011295 [Ascochyta rabiei]UPX21091.1 hypothetical protein EKO05_0011295 [Ascochyta rabiei]